MATVVIKADKLAKAAVLRARRVRHILTIIHLHHIVTMGVGFYHLTETAAAKLGE
jgi:hypothetical protein